MNKVGVTTTNRTEIIQLVDVFRARIVDVANDSMIIEITRRLGKDRRVRRSPEAVRNYGDGPHRGWFR